MCVLGYEEVSLCVCAGSAHIITILTLSCGRACEMSDSWVCKSGRS